MPRFLGYPLDEVGVLHCSLTGERIDMLSFNRTTKTLEIYSTIGLSAEISSSVHHMFKRILKYQLMISG